MKVFMKTAIAATVLSLTASTFAATTTAPTVSPAERAKIESVVHQYLIRNPEVLMEAIQVLQQKQSQQAQQAMKQTQDAAGSFAQSLFHQANDPVIGNPSGKVTVVEFFDYQCPHCVDMAPVMTGLTQANPNVRVIFKEFPIRGPVSEFAARAALAANKQGKYTAFSHALLNGSRTLTTASVMQIAQAAGLNVEQLKKDMEDSTIKNQLKANIKLAQDLKLMGTPAIFVGKTDANGKDAIKFIPGQVDQAQLQSIVDATK
jgi:protein-disulfide isomerase